MKILVAHNLYQQRGGEDAMVGAEVRLLEAHGHQVVRYQRENDELKARGPWGTVSAGVETLWSAKSMRQVRSLIQKEKPDVAHFHNTFPLISPAVYHACSQFGVPVVQTLHNYRLICPAATCLREGKVCEECLGRSVAWPSLAHGCYRGSHATTAAVASMLAVHRFLGTWREKVDLYIALSEFARKKFVAGGLPAERIMVKPNFVDPDPGTRQGQGEYALFVGRLSEEKGLRVLLAACRELHGKIPLRIAGEGPLWNEIEQFLSSNGVSGVTLMGRLSRAEIIRAMHEARFLVFPSIWFEGFPVSITEAFACGLPVIASRLGSMAEIVTDEVTGLHFSAGDSQDLSRQIDWAWTHPGEMEEMGGNARTEYENKYSADRNYEQFAGLWNRLGLNEHPK
jgi:glycosyltransferase involved in cell wall biosynthesis